MMGLLPLKTDVLEDAERESLAPTPPIGKEWSESGFDLSSLQDAALPSLLVPSRTAYRMTACCGPSRARFFVREGGEWQDRGPSPGRFMMTPDGSAGDAGENLFVDPPIAPEPFRQNEQRLTYTEEATVFDPAAWEVVRRIADRLAQQRAALFEDAMLKRLP